MEKAKADANDVIDSRIQGERLYNQETLWDRMDESMPEIKARFTDELSYLFVNNVFKFMDSPAGQELSEEDSKAVKAVLADYINVKEYYDDLVMQRNAIYNSFLVARESDKVKAAEDTPEVKMYLDEHRRRMQEVVEKMQVYGVLADKLGKALAFVTDGAQKYGSDSVLLLSKYGYSSAEEKMAQEAGACKQFRTLEMEKGDALSRAIRKKFPSDFDDDDDDGDDEGEGPTAEALIQFVYSDTQQKFGANLASTEDEEYNDDLVELFAARYEEQHTVGVDDALQNRLAVAGEAVLKPKVEAIMNTDYHEFEGLSEEALVEKLPILMKLTMGIGVILQLSREPSDISDMTIIEKILGKPPAVLNDVDPEGFAMMNLEYSYKRTEFDAKLAFFNGLMIKARGTSFLSDGVSEGGNLAQYLTNDEIMELSSDPLNAVSPEDVQVLAYARQMLEFGNFRSQNGLDQLRSIDLIRKSFNYQGGQK